MTLKQTDLDGNIIEYIDEYNIYEIRNDSYFIISRKPRFNWNILKDGGLYTFQERVAIVKKHLNDLDEENK